MLAVYSTLLPPCVASLLCPLYRRTVAPTIVDPEPLGRVGADLRLDDRRQLSRQLPDILVSIPGPDGSHRGQDPTDMAIIRPADRKGRNNHRTRTKGEDRGACDCGSEPAEERNELASFHGILIHQKCDNTVSTQRFHNTPWSTMARYYLVAA